MYRVVFSSPTRTFRMEFFIETYNLQGTPLHPLAYKHILTEKWRSLW